MGFGVALGGWFHITEKAPDQFANFVTGRLINSPFHWDIMDYAARTVGALWREPVEMRGSAGERYVAETLRHYGIRYQFEAPLTVQDHGKLRIYYPDFWLPDLSLAVEYLGMMDRPDYRTGVEHKRAVYKECGVACLYVTPEDFELQWPRRLLREMRATLLDRLHTFDDATIVTGTRIV